MGTNSCYIKKANHRVEIIFLVIMKCLIGNKLLRIAEKATSKDFYLSNTQSSILLKPFKELCLFSIFAVLLSSIKVNLHTFNCIIND